MEKKEREFKPFISADKDISELTVTSVLLGIILAVVFGAANAYLGLRVGMTVSASIPAAVISMGVMRIILKRESILENNMVQTIGSAGESVAAGAIFTIPALFMWATEYGKTAPSLIEITLIAALGGILGILFMVPLRKALIVKEHGVLPYPEGTACSEVLLAGEEGGASAAAVFWGLGIASIYKFVTDGIKLFPSEVDYSFKKFKGAGFGADVLPALVSVGYICGIKISTVMFAGGALGWFVLMPLISMFGGDTVLFPSDVAISAMGTWAIWKSYIKYIGAGAVAAGGIISLIKSMPLIVSTFGKAMKDYGNKEFGDSSVRTDADIPMKHILVAIVAIAVVMWLVPALPVNFFGALIIIIFGFFFATVSARLVGLVGSSNNPVSGMTIATLLVATLFLKYTGQTGYAGMVSAIAIGSVICIIAAISGDTSQDLKTGYILGATPKKQQIGEIIGVIAASIAIGGVLYLLNAAWTFDSAELPAPQAVLMKMIVEGVMNANLPWGLVGAGACLAVVIELLGIPVLPFAVGLYLPVHLSAGIMAGGLIRFVVEKKNKDVEPGILFSSGMIAGEGLVGILLAVFALIPAGKQTLAQVIDISGSFSLGMAGSVICFAGLAALLYYFAAGKKESK
ncbi:OPT family oligopeptide transporter [[Clostridium] polysaccharolyticum]|uniref:Putative oligopeptide transporter, OPT family n=1 Tax=[Clostridium] polysaccharolyticum TaxID=29364 RepID=A0A1I0FKG6_9FIRM|nr:oligopeptide transporter, OPT family [[Clostridium] polysaccharolyticum]SET58061.1 putative oligopeptide transporter, OPT family [[Clostridium] polysaccharolyticum]